MSTQDNAQHSKHYPPPEALARTAHVAGRAAYDALVAEAQADYEGYWARLARGLPWSGRPGFRRLRATAWTLRFRRSCATPTCARSSSSRVGRRWALRPKVCRAEFARRLPPWAASSPAAASGSSDRQLDRLPGHRRLEARPHALGRSREQLEHGDKLRRLRAQTPVRSDPEQPAAH